MLGCVRGTRLTGGNGRWCHLAWDRELGLALVREL